MDKKKRILILDLTGSRNNQILAFRENLLSEGQVTLINIADIIDKGFAYVIRTCLFSSFQKGYFFISVATYHERHFLPKCLFLLFPAKDKHIFDDKLEEYHFSVLHFAFIESAQVLKEFFSGLYILFKTSIWLWRANFLLGRNRKVEKK